MLFFTRKGPARRGLRHRFVPGAEIVEARVVLSTLGAAIPSASVALAAQTLNQKVVAFLKANVGKRIGSGECADVATEALRVAGAKFIKGSPSRNPNATGVDSPGTGDYDWGSLVKVVEYKSGRVVDSSPSTKIKPGDVIQYRNAVFKNGSSTSTATHHTAVVAAVDSQGRVTQVYQQNISSSGVKGSNRTLTVSSLDLSKLKGGWVRIFRPETRSSRGGLYEVTIVNNSTTSQSIYSGSSRYALTAANTTGSMTSIWWMGGSAPKVTLNGKNYTLVTGAGYQITGSGSSLKLSRLSA